MKYQLKFVQFQVVPESESWIPEIYGLDQNGQIWVYNLNLKDKGWKAVNQTGETK